MKKIISCFCFMLGVFFAVGSAQAWVGQVEKLAGAQPDECYAGLGEPYPTPTSLNPFTCPDLGGPYAIEKTNQTYVWSLTVVPDSATPAGTGEQLWFGTGANILCTTQGAFLSEVDPGGFGPTVCEFDDSQMLLRYPNLPAQYGDWRPPKIYQYDLDSKTLIDRTPNTDPLRNRSMGLRSAGYHNGVVFLAGGSLGGGISMFAFNAATGAYLGSRQFTAYRTIRKWLVVNNALYTGVGTSTTGRILRWTGSVSNPWSFSEVGRVLGVPRELTEYVAGNGQRRIAVTARNVYLSPAIQGSGLTTGQAGSWISIWSPDQYEPDYVTRTTYVGGGIAFLNGWLYFGTMHIPGNAADVHQTCSASGFPIPSNLCFGEASTSSERQAISAGTARATSIWRIRNAESASRVTQLLYGEAELPAFDPNYDPDDVLNTAFPLVPNTGDYVPLLGSSGFDHDFNNYAWVMEVVGNSLFVGTMDYSTLFNPADPSAGADLWRIDGTASDVPVSAVAETTTAFGLDEFPTYTYRPYGFRCLNKSYDGTRLFAGMATGVNLGAVDDGAGWQLLQLSP